jgi:hypothetical protein
MDSKLLDEKLLTRYRHINVECEWWDYVYDEFKEYMQAQGVHVERMFFSGFWSQGDGACFEGHVEDWEVFLKTLGYGDNPVLIKHAVDNWRFHVAHHGHYYHENCTDFTGDLCMPDGYDDNDFIAQFCPYVGDGSAFRATTWLILLTQGRRTDFEREFTEMFKSNMRKLYAQLEKEYDHLVSDEAVSETVIANDLTETQGV